MPELSRIEHGEKEADKVVLETLFQRLGKSVDKLEIAISDQEYRMILLRTLFIDNLMQGDDEVTQKIMQEYAESPGSEKPPHHQYHFIMQAAYAYRNDGELSKCQELLEQAIVITFPEWKEANWDTYCLCTQELQLLLMITYIKYKQKITDTRAYIQKLARYIERHCTDEEEKVRVYPQCMWLLAQSYKEEQRYEAAYEACNGGIRCLTQNGVLTLLDELLSLKQLCLENMQKITEQNKEKQRIKDQRVAIRFVYMLAEHKIPDDPVTYFLHINQQTELIISNELVRKLRQALNMSQEKVAGDICTQETLSRIESGMRTPNRKNLEKILQSMGMEPESHTGYIVTDDYEMLEKVRELKRSSFANEPKKVEVLLDELENKLDMQNSLNRQFIESNRLIANLNDSQAGVDEMIHKLKQVLCYTMKGYKDSVYRIPTREECTILNQMALWLKRAGKMQEAGRIYEQILEQYEKSRVSEVHHAISVMLVFMNYAGLLECCDELEKAENIGIRGLKLAVDCERGDVLGILLANLSCVYEKRDLPAECIEYLTHSYYLLDLFNHTEDTTVIRNRLLQRFEVRID